MTGWKPIETAPKDRTSIRTKVDLYGTKNGEPRRFTDAFWADRIRDGLVIASYWDFPLREYDIWTEYKFTHWRPLPEPPVTP